MREPGSTQFTDVLLAGDPATLAPVAEALAGVGLAVGEAMPPHLAWERFQRGAFRCVVTDLGGAAHEGLTLLRRVRSPESRDSRVPVMLISDACTLSIAAAAGRSGVSDCFALTTSGISSLVTRIARMTEVARLPLPIALLGQSPAVTAARDRIASLIHLDTSVLISGERGTGHWQVGQHLHASGKLAQLPLQRVDCTAHPDARAHGAPSTWFLEEVQDLTPPAQNAWRHFIRERQGIGGRVIASTTRDLCVLAGRGAFDANLARDLSQFEVWLPPLRERRDDFPKLIHSILASVGERLGRPAATISPRAIERLCTSAWWENFADLDRALESLAAFALGGEISESDADLVVVESDPVARAARERIRSEREELVRLVDECGGNFTRIAERLKVDRGTVRYRLRKHGLLQRGG